MLRVWGGARPGRKRNQEKTWFSVKDVWPQSDPWGALTGEEGSSVSGSEMGLGGEGGRGLSNIYLRDGGPGLK